LVPDIPTDIVTAGRFTNGFLELLTNRARLTEKLVATGQIEECLVKADGLHMRGKIRKHPHDHFGDFLVAIEAGPNDCCIRAHASRLGH